MRVSWTTCSTIAKPGRVVCHENTGDVLRLTDIVIGALSLTLSRAQIGRDVLSVNHTLIEASLMTASLGEELAKEDQCLGLKGGRFHRVLYRAAELSKRCLMRLDCALISRHHSHTALFASSCSHPERGRSARDLTNTQDISESRTLAVSRRNKDAPSSQ